jgi:hypothetical protein
LCYSHADLAVGTTGPKGRSADKQATPFAMCRRL